MKQANICFWILITYLNLLFTIYNTVHLMDKAQDWAYIAKDDAMILKKNVLE